MPPVTDALTSDRSVVLDICASLSEADWAAPSGCPGWSVQDLVSHFGALFWLVVDRTQVPDAQDRRTEEANDFHLASRRHLTPAHTLADYEQVSAKAIEILAALDGLTGELPLGDLGTYPLSVIPSAYAFDHYVHIRSDLFAPRGPLAPPPPPTDEPRMSAALDWIEAALPQQNAALLATLDAPVELAVEGPAPRLIRTAPGTPAARVTCPGPELTACITQRAPWDSSGARLDGPPAALAVIRQLKIF